MNYLDSFRFPNVEVESSFFLSVKLRTFTTFYPFQVLAKKEMPRLTFEPITIFYGGNGSGKTTALNVIAEKLQLKRTSRYNRSNFFEDYLTLCDAEWARKIPKESQIITSDDVFDYVLNMRTLNEGIDEKREELFEEYLNRKHSSFQMRSMEDYEQLHQVVEARRKTMSRYVRESVMGNVRTKSNGESAFEYFVERIEKPALYLLDEPENSLSPALQQELASYISDSARFFNSQFILSTHSPFFLSIPGARIYNLDAEPVAVQDWTTLPNIRAYYDFFKKNEDAFLKGEQ